MNRYYNPKLTEEQVGALDRENMAVLAAVQGSLGNMRPEIRALFVDAGPTSVVLHFVVAEGQEAACQEDIDDTIGDYTAQTWGADMDAKACVHVEEVPHDWAARGWRPVYWAKGWAAWREP